MNRKHHYDGKPLDRWLWPVVREAFAERAGPMSDYTRPNLPHPCAAYCWKNGCPCADDCAGQPCYLLKT